MINFRFIRIDESYAGITDPLPLLLAREETYLAGTNFVGSFSKDITERMMSFETTKKIVILNQQTLNASPVLTLPSKSPFPFCSLYRNGNGRSVMSVSEALVEGNYFLCFDREADPEETRERLVESRNQHVIEYRYHVKLEEVMMWKTHYPHYVNMDRDSESIGYSSWDGDLTRWFDSGFTSRIQYGINAGLFPEE